MRLFNRASFIPFILIIFLLSCSEDDPIIISLPTVTTSSASATGIASGTGGGNVREDGNGTIKARGLVWGTSNSPTTTSSSKSIDGNGLGAFTSTMTGLNPNTKYFVRAYATNSEGTAYGNEVSFTTNAIIPATLSTTAATSITSTTASVGGDVTAEGTNTVIEKGIVYSTSTEPTVALSTKTSNGSGIGSFTGSLSGLQPATTYFARAYATTSSETSYGNEISFTTISIPTVSTKNISAVTSSSGSGGGNVEATGNATVTARGIVWSTSSNPTTALVTKTVDGSGAGSFTSSMTNLNPGTTYFVRAYATNSEGTAYGNQVNFTTKVANNLSLGFDGINDFVAIDITATTDFNKNGVFNLGNFFTLEAWVYLDNDGSAYQTFFHKWRTINEYSLELYDNKLNFVVATNGGIAIVASPTNLPRGEWVHIAGVRDGSNIRVYENGVFKNAELSGGTTNGPSSEALIIGKRSTSDLNPLKGRMDEIRIWNVARTTSEINGNRFTPVATNSTGLIGYYPIKSDATANGNNSGKIVLEDATGNNNQGTLNNFLLSGTVSNWITNFCCN